jgi:hypothetical protein
MAIEHFEVLKLHSIFDLHVDVCMCFLSFFCMDLHFFLENSIMLTSFYKNWQLFFKFTQKVFLKKNIL